MKTRYVVCDVRETTHIVISRDLFLVNLIKKQKEILVEKNLNLNGQ